MDENRLKLIKAFSAQPNKLLDKQRITNQDTLMYPVFQNALRGLKNILDSSEKWVNESNNPIDRDFYTYGNNILAFCGPRGQGKTSTMLSLTYALEHCNDSYEGNYLKKVDSNRNKYYRLKEEDPVWSETINERDFLVMPPIDPTVLDEKESVVGVVLAWLLAEINEGWKKKDKPADFIEQKQVEVLQHFQKCRDCLALHSGVKERDLSALIKSSNILELKKHLYAIINFYFQLYGHTGKKHYLIIQLDDTDMDMVNAYEVLEDARKFLSLPRTVVMMATYLRQLRTLVAKHYEDALALSHSKKEDVPERADCMQMAAKYLDKLIPSQQMVHINSFRYQRDLNGKVKIRDFIDDLSDILADNNDEYKVSEEDLDADLEEEFYELIQEKTGLIFLKHGTYINNILPTSLRGLVHLYQVLDKMETPSYPDEGNYENAMSKEPRGSTYYTKYITALRIRQRNLIMFEDYFRNDWCYNNLKEKDQEIMWAISQAHIAPKLRIIRNLLKKRWPWISTLQEQSSDVANDVKTPKMSSETQLADVENAADSGREEKARESTSSLSLGTEPAGTQKAQMDVHANNRTDIGSGSSHFCFTNIVMLLNEGEDRAESMDDLMLVFAVRTHLSIIMHKLYMADILNTLDNKETASSFVKTDSQMHKEGIYRPIVHQQLQSFMKYYPPFEQKKANLTSKRKEIRKLLKDFSEIKANNACLLNKTSTERRLEALYNLLFWNKLTEFHSETDDTILSHNKLSFALQESVFRVLCNFDVLRLYLSDSLDRFVTCAKYVYQSTISFDEHQISLEKKHSIYELFERLSQAMNAKKGRNNESGAPKEGRIIPNAFK